MAMVLIRCPVIDLPVSTGLFMDEPTFNAADLPDEDRRLSCPLCQQVHVWRKEEAYLVEDEEAPLPAHE